MGGEKAIKGMGGSGVPGSPPHGRGKAEYQAAMDTVDGITPAWAGKSLQADETLLYCEDHPRMGGEKYYTTLGCERQ